MLLPASSGTEDYAEAVAEAKRVETVLNAGSGLLREDRLMAIVTAYVAANKLSDSYVTNCFSALKAAPALESLPLSQVGKASLLRARDQMRVGRANSTVNGYMRALRAAWNWASERDLVGVPWPKLKKLRSKSKKRPYEPEEVAAVIDWLHKNPRGYNDWHAYFSLLADTGLRPCELVGLKGAHVDRQRCLVLIVRAKTGQQGEDREEEWVRVPKDTLALLPQRESSEWLWPSRGVQAYGHITVNGALIALRRALAALGLLEQNLDQYSLRRWWVDSADAENVPKGDAMKQVGHKKLETHMGYRRNSRRQVSQEVVEKVRQRRLRAALHDAPQEGAEQASCSELTPVGAGVQAASSDCSR